MLMIKYFCSIFLRTASHTVMPHFRHFTPSFWPLQFPKDCPCGGPDQSRPPAASVTLPGHDLAQHGQTMELRAKQTSRAPTEAGKRQNNTCRCTRLASGGRAENVDVDDTSMWVRKRYFGKKVDKELAWDKRVDWYICDSASCEPFSPIKSQQWSK